MDPLAPTPSCPWWHAQFFRLVQVRPISMAEASYTLSGHRSLRAADREGFADVDRLIGELATGVTTFDEWRHRMFVDAGFTGNGADYHDPRNSFLPDVLSRRLGIPITLALVGQLVAERAGLVSWGIGLPGHFLLGVAPAGSSNGVWSDDGARIVDPFGGGRTMTIDDIAQLFASMFGDRQKFHTSMLEKTDDTNMLIRMLANLKANYARSNDLDGLTAVVRLRTCLPGWTLDEGRELVRLHAVSGSLDEAVSVLGELDIRFPEAHDILATERVRLAVSLN